jgi:polygalacturonase
MKRKSFSCSDLLYLVIGCVSSNLTIKNLTIWAPGDSPNTDGIVPGMYVGCQILLLEPL